MGGHFRRGGVGGIGVDAGIGSHAPRQGRPRCRCRWRTRETHRRNRRRLRAIDLFAHIEEAGRLRIAGEPLAMGSPQVGRPRPRNTGTPASIKDWAVSDSMTDFNSDAASNNSDRRPLCVFPAPHDWQAVQPILLKMHLKCTNTSAAKRRTCAAVSPRSKIHARDGRHHTVPMRRPPDERDPFANAFARCRRPAAAVRDATRRLRSCLRIADTSSHRACASPRARTGALNAHRRDVMMQVMTAYRQTG